MHGRTCHNNGDYQVANLSKGEKKCEYSFFIPEKQTIRN
jgi:hypothetical protein